MAEKRKFTRLPIKMLVKWRKVTPSLHDQDTHLDVIRDISRGGLCFITEQFCDSNERLNVEVKLPSGAVISAQGVIMRVTNTGLYDIDANIEYEIGVEIDTITPEHKKEWDHFVFEYSGR